VRLDQNGHERRHVQCSVDLVRREVARQQRALVIVQHLLAHAVAHGLGQAAFDLALSRLRINDRARVDRIDQLEHAHLARLRVDLHVSKRGGEGRRRLVGHVAGHGHDLVLLVAMQRLQCHFFDGDAMAGRRPHAPVVQRQARRIVLQHLRGHSHDLLPHVLSGLLHRAAGDIGRRAGIRALVERRHVGIGRVDDDILDRHTQHLAGHLRQHRVRARTEIGGAHQQVE